MTVRRFGTFLSSKKREGTGAAYTAVNYEFEFYTEDCDGGQIVDGVLYPARQGMVTLPKPGQTVQMRHPYKCYFMNIGTTDPELQDLLNRLPTQFSVWNMDEIIDQLQQMMVLGSEDTLYRRLRLQSHACRIIAILARHAQSKDHTSRSAFQHQKTLLMIDRYMRDHIAEDLNLADLAKRCSLDPTYFHKLYTAAFGDTPAHRILRYRIEAAKTGLLSGNISLSDLSEKCGFSSQTYFCYKFRQVTGMTPTQYRDKMLSQAKNE